MFTGIIETTAKVISIRKLRKSLRLTVKPKKTLTKLKIGDSIALNGICLTLVKKSQSGIDFDIVQETVRRTNIKDITKGSWVNIERALKYGDRMSGHYVMGHIDATGKVQSIKKRKRDIEYRIQFPVKLKKWILPKGCIAIDGISLTIGKVLKNTFTLYLIPHTLKITHLPKNGVGYKVNIETDILLKRRKK